MIRAMKMSDDEYKEIKTKAREFAETNFSIKSSVNYFLEILHERGE